MKYQEFIADITTNDATIEAVVVALTLGKAFRGACQDAIDSGRIVRRWWESHGRIYAAMTAIVLLLVGGAVVASSAAVYRWLRNAGVPGALAGADAVCRFLLCYDEPVAPVGEMNFLVAELEELAAISRTADNQIGWAVARWPELAA